MDWNARYADPEYIFGREPAGFVPRRIGMLPEGSRILCLADGEGRNSVGFAKGGHDVVAMEMSPNAQAKAKALAGEHGVTVDFRLADITEWDWAEDEYDAVVGIFIQFAPPPLRSQIHRGIARTIRPGGLVMLHGFAPRQVEYGTGGPPSAENMYTLDLLRGDFPGWEELAAEDFDMAIDDGPMHGGLSALVDFIAKKP